MIGTKHRLGERIDAGSMTEVFRARVVGTHGVEPTVFVKRVLGLGGLADSLLLRHDVGPAGHTETTRAAESMDGICTTMTVADTNMPRVTSTPGPSREPAPTPSETSPAEQARDAPARVRHGAALRPSQGGNAYPYFVISEADR